MNGEHAKDVHQRAETLSNQSELNIDKLPYPELLNNLLAESLSLFEVNSGCQAVENMLSLLKHPKRKGLLFQVHLDALHQWPDIAKAIERKKFEKC